MNTKTLNHLAFLSFQRKARKIHKKTQIINLMDQSFSEETIIQSFNTLILWSEESGFYSIKCGEFNTRLVSLINFPEKYSYDEVYHFGVLTPHHDKLYLYRCFEQLSDGSDEMVPYGLQFMTDQCRNKDHEFESDSDFTFSHGYFPVNARWENESGADDNDLLIARLDEEYTKEQQKKDLGWPYSEEE